MATTPVDNTQVLVMLIDHQRLNAYASAAATAFYLWDMILTLEAEVTYIWPGRTSIVEILYFLNRYFRLFMSLALTFFMVWPKPSSAMCLAYGTSGTIGVGVVGTFLTGVILQIRLCALCGCNKTLKLCVLLLFAVQMISISVLAGLEVAALFHDKSTIARPGLPVCNHQVSPTFFAICIPILAFDFIVLVLACYGSVQRYKLFPPKTRVAQDGKHLVAVLFRDSILYFAVNVVVYLANILMWNYGPSDLYALITTWCNVVTGVAASRMLVNTRRAIRE